MFDIRSCLELSIIIRLFKIISGTQLHVYFSEIILHLFKKSVDFVIELFSRKSYTYRLVLSAQLSYLLYYSLQTLNNIITLLYV